MFLLERIARKNHELGFATVVGADGVQLRNRMLAAGSKAKRQVCERRFFQIIVTAQKRSEADIDNAWKIAQEHIAKDDPISIGVVGRIAMFTVLPLIGVAIAIQPLEGYNYGEMAILYRRCQARIDSMATR